MKKIAEYLSVRHFKNWKDTNDVTSFVSKATQIKTKITNAPVHMVGHVIYYKLGDEIVATFEKRSGVLHLKTKYIKNTPDLPDNIVEIK